MDTHRRAIITAIAALCAIAAQQAPAQSSGSFAGDFFAGGNGAQLISTITCSPGADLACSKSGSVFLGATIKMPGSRSKYLWIGASLETALLTQTGVTGTYTLKLHIAATATANTTSITAPAKVSVGVRVGSLGVQIVQVQTPFNSLCFDLVNNTSC